MQQENLAIAVFGSAEPTLGQPLYEQARTLGRLLARAGYPVITGGYGGVMEGASHGANEGGGTCIGVGCTIFDDRDTNPFLTRVVRSSDLYERTRELVDRSRGYVVLGGKAGTLAELSFLWALHRAGCLGPRPVVLLGDVWGPFLEFLDRNAMLDSPQLEITHPVRTPEAAVELLDRHLSSKESIR